MGLFSFFLKKNEDPEKEVGSELFNEQYAELKELATQILKYEYYSPSRAYRIYDMFVPLAVRFLEIANQIDRKKALRTFTKEAKNHNPNDRYPYHPVFKSIAWGKPDDWDKAIEDIKNLYDRFTYWHTEIDKFNAKYVDVPVVDIELSDIGLKRNKMIDIPEIKYTSIGKSFNKDRLLKFVVIDTETTGLKASSERIVQLSAVKYVDWEPVEAWSTYINPKRPIPAEASAVNKITDEMLIDKPTIKQVAESFTQFVKDYDVVGYNLPFDFKFLFAEGIDLTVQKRRYYDVYSLAKKAYMDELDSFSLEDVTKYLRIYYNAHNSLSDCYATAEVFGNVIKCITF
ncbi:MAG: 3'-5' exonuclease [Solobacterium sp.]|nr:3'-5' exonuclease [Solobacterium sp.]